MNDSSAKERNQTDSLELTKGRVLALDLGRSRVGLAVSDELGMTARALAVIRRTNWKALVRSIAEVVEKLDVKTLVVGLPLRLDGTQGNAAAEALQAARNLELSLRIPVHLQDERHTSQSALENLRDRGHSEVDIPSQIDGEAARLILLDFLSTYEIDKPNGIDKLDI